jgi:hypothetical protein
VKALASLLEFGTKKEYQKLQLSEMTLDDNGLKDEEFARLLETAYLHATFEKLSYTNN